MTIIIGIVICLPSTINLIDMFMIFFISFAAQGHCKVKEITISMLNNNIIGEKVNERAQRYE